MRGAKRYSKNQNIFVGFTEMLKKIMVQNWILSKIAFISFRGRMLKSKNLKMGTSSEAQFTLTGRAVSVDIAKANVLMGILFILLYSGFPRIRNHFFGYSLLFYPLFYMKNEICFLYKGVSYSREPAVLGV